MNFNFKKKFGQNFLIDQNVLNNIINEVTPTEDDLIIEIGPGSGNLTKRLLEYNCYLLAYEIDLDTKEYLNPLMNNKTGVIYDDFLKRNISNDIRDIPYDNLYIIANLPYYITTPIIEKIIQERLKPKKMLLMVQKEVADRIASEPGSKSYGSLTVYLNYYFNIKKLYNVGKTAFKPVPKVDSAVLEFITHNKYQADNEEIFFQLIKDAFQFKRKNLNNNLVKYNREVIDGVLKNHNLSLNSRGEEITIELFIEIANKLSKID